MPRKPKTLEAQTEALRKRGRSALTEGQSNILMASLIDLMADGKGRRECFAVIKKFYQDTLNQDIALSTYYERYDKAKSMWLTNLSLPNIENYKREKLYKSELLEEEIRLNSTKDITDQAKIILDINKYTDNLVGLNAESQSDSIVISINTDKTKVINALEIDEN